MMHSTFKVLDGPLDFVKFIYSNLNFSCNMQYTHKRTVQLNHGTNSTSDIAIYCVFCKRSNNN